MHKFWITARTGLGEAAQSLGDFRTHRSQHSSGGVGSLTARFSPLDDKHAESLLAQRDRQRQAYDPGPNNYDVPRLHTGIVKECVLAERQRSPDHFCVSVI